MSDKIRTEFEAMFGAPPYEEDLRRYPDNDGQAWPGQYRSIDVQRAWEAWLASRKSAIKEAAQGRAALIEVAEAARTYYTRYAQDEADDGEYSCAGNGGQMTGCSDQQGKDALALRGALSRLAAAESRQGGETS